MQIYNPKKYLTLFQDPFFNGAHLSNEGRKELENMKGLFTSGDVYYNCRDFRLQIPRCVTKISLA